jgi:hypothetical protein
MEDPMSSLSRPFGIAALVALAGMTPPGADARELTDPARRVPAARLQPVESAAGDGFGHAIAMDGEIAAIGAPHADGGRGAVVVFERRGELWHERARLSALDGAANDDFGGAVAISGHTILVGASGHRGAGSFAGAAYVFQLDDGRWRQAAKLTPGSPRDVRFGWSVALAGDTAVVGAPYSREAGEVLNVGSAAIFSRRDGLWSQTTRLTVGQPGGARSSDLFGWAVAADRATVAIGARLDGAVYVYELSRGEWRRTAVVRDRTHGNQFGTSVALEADRLLVGAPAAARPAPRTGTAVLYTRQPDGGWAEAARLSFDGLRPGSRFGSSVALDGKTAAVGMRENDGLADVEESGGTVAFRIAAGPAAPGARLHAPQPTRGAHLGAAVAVGDNLVLAGAPGPRSAAGAVYAFSLGEPAGR